MDLIENIKDNTVDSSINNANINNANRKIIKLKELFDYDTKSVPNTITKHDTLNPIETHKVFVGNVPFQCTKDDFMNCFKKLPGYIDSGIIRRYKSKLSRGFGFVVLNNEVNAQKLINGGFNIKLRGRPLRFSKYAFNMIESGIDDTRDTDGFIKVKSSTGKNNTYCDVLSNTHINTTIPASTYTNSNPVTNNISTNSINTNIATNYTRYSRNTVFISDLSPETTEIELTDILSNIGPVQSCSVRTNKGLTTGVVTFKDFNSYKKALNGLPKMTIQQYKPKVNNLSVNNTISVQNAYREGFKAGHIVGFQQGYHKGYGQMMNFNNYNYDPPGPNICDSASLMDCFANFTMPKCDHIAFSNIINS